MQTLPANFQPKFDAAESVFVERALLYVETEAYNTLIPPMEGRKYVPVEPAPVGAKFTTYKQFTRTGIARLMTEKGQDLPNAGLFVKEFTHQFYPVGASYQYDYLDLLAAGMSMQNGGPPLNLDLELSTAAYEAIEKKLDLISAIGSGTSNGFGIEDEADVGMLGLANITNASLYVLATGSGPGATQAWSTKTPDEIIADLTGIVASIISLSFKTFVPDTLLTPIAQYESIGGRSMGDGRSDTILSYFLKTNKHIKEMDSWAYLSGAGGSGSDRMICYKKDKRMVRHMIAMEFTQLPPQFENLTTKVPCLAKTAGVISPYPTSIAYGDHL